MKLMNVCLFAVFVLACGTVKKSNSVLKQENQTVSEGSWQLQVQRQAYVWGEESKTRQQDITVWSASPYRWRPDSGVLSGGGYLKVQAVERQQRKYGALQKGKELLNETATETVKHKEVQHERQKAREYTGKNKVLIFVAVVFCLVVIVVLRRLICIF